MIFWIFVIICIVGVAVIFLKGFDRASGRGPKQVSYGIEEFLRKRDKERK